MSPWTQRRQKFNLAHVLPCLLLCMAPPSPFWKGRLTQTWLELMVGQNVIFCIISDTTLTRMQLLRVLLSATVLGAPTLAIQQAEGGITCSIKHCLPGQIYPRIQQCSIDHSSSRKIKRSEPGNFLTCTICEAVMTAIDQSIVDPTNEQVPSFSFHST